MGISDASLGSPGIRRSIRGRNRRRYRIRGRGQMATGQTLSSALSALFGMLAPYRVQWHAWES
jgi:hypothetical protein